jgi:hypothetical protein
LSISVFVRTDSAFVILGCQLVEEGEIDRARSTEAAAFAVVRWAHPSAPLDAVLSILFSTRHGRSDQSAGYRRGWRLVRAAGRHRGRPQVAIPLIFSLTVLVQLTLERTLERTHVRPVTV